MAFHENDCSRYIPLYLTSYQEAVSTLPSFLNASQTFGYRLPDDITKLIQNLTNRNSMSSSAERETKDKFFIRKMMDNRKKMLALEHSNCIQEYCTKVSFHLLRRKKCQTILASEIKKNLFEYGY